MRKNVPVVALATTAILAVTATGCSSRDSGASAASSTGQSIVNTSACPASATTAVADGASIKIGSIEPMSGQYASVGTNVSAGIKIAFSQANADGGVDGHQLELDVKDDQYDASQTVAQQTSLIQKDHVFATLGQIGTPNVAAAQPLAEQSCTPQLWVGSGAPQFGDPAHHPWTTSGFMSYSTEAQAWVDYLKASDPNARIATLVLSSDLGAAYSTSFDAAAKTAGLDVVASQETSPTATTVTNEITNLLAAKPDVVILESFVTSCANAMGALAQGGFKGTVIASYACAGDSIFPILGKVADGALTLAINRQMSDAGNTDIQAFKATAAKYDPGLKLDGDTLTGYRLGDLLVKTLKAAAELPGGLTPANAMTAAWSLDSTWFASWGGKAQLNGTSDAYALETGQMVRYQASDGRFVPVGQPIDREGKTGTYTK